VVRHITQGRLGAADCIKGSGGKNGKGGGQNALFRMSRKVGEKAKKRGKQKKGGRG